MTTPPLPSGITPPPVGFASTISIKALEAALVKLKITGITATQLLEAVHEEENKLHSTSHWSRASTYVPPSVCEQPPLF